MHRTAFAVAEHLNFDMARLAEIFFDIDGVIAERGLRFRACGGKGGRKIGFAARDLHAAPAAACRGFNQHGKADFLRDLLRLVVVGNAALGAWHDRNAEALRGALRLDLVAHDADMLGRRANEADLVIAQDFRKARVLREKPVARMHGIRAGDLAGGEQIGNVEIAFACGRGPDANRFVRKLHMHRVGVGGGMHRDRVDAKLLAGAQNTKRDLAAVRDENLIEHAHPNLSSRTLCAAKRSGIQNRRPRCLWIPALRAASPRCGRDDKESSCRNYSMMTSGSPNSTGWPSSTTICVTVPARGAGIAFIVFIASIIRIVCPAETFVPTSTNGFAPGSGER